MSFAVSVFDVFAYAVPGSLYLGLLAYVVAWLWPIPMEAFATPDLLAALTLAIFLSFLLGHLSYGLGNLINEWLPGFEERTGEASRRKYLERCPQAQGRPFVQADPWLLLAKIQLVSQDAAGDIARLRSTGLMLRHCSPPLALVTVALLGEMFYGGHPLLLALGAFLTGSASVGTLRQGRKAGEWARFKTLEMAFWIPEIDKSLTPPNPSP